MRTKWKILLGSTALSTILQFCPGLVSKPFDEYMKEKGYPGDLSAHFHTANRRVYHRYNPLVPFHRAGNLPVMLTQELLDKPSGEKAFMVGISPLIYPIFLGQSMINSAANFFTPINASSMQPDIPFGQRTSFIYPPREAPAGRVVNAFLPFENSYDFKFRNDPDALKRTLFQMIMLHEARHGDQNSVFNGSLDESDADLYAFKVLEARETDPAVLAETRELITHARILQTVIKNDDSHVTGLALGRDGDTPFESHQDVRTLIQLHDLLKEAHSVNKGNLDDISEDILFIHLARKMAQAGAFAKTPELAKTAKDFLAAADYFNALSGNRIFDPAFDLSKIRIDYLHKEFKPAPDKLQVPRKKASLPSV